MRKRSWGFLAIGALLLVLLLYLGYSGWRLVQRVRSFQSSVGRLEAAMRDAESWSDAGRWSGIAGDVQQMESDLRAMRSEGAPLLLVAGWLGWARAIGPDVAAAPALLDMGIQLAEAAAMGVDLATPLVNSMNETPEAARPGLSIQILRLLDNHPDELFSMAQRLEQAAAYRQQVDLNALSPWLQRIVLQVDAYLPLVQAAARLGPMAADLMGGAGARTYLLLAENNEELRATGGFISGVGEVILVDGGLFSLRFMDSYAVDDFSKPHPRPPPALARYMQADYLVFRDANWSPDFPTAAQVISSLYQLDQGVTVDGVVAFDLITLGYLLEGLGPLHIEGYDETIAAENYSWALVAYWENPGAGQRMGEEGWWSHRKDFAGAVLSAAIVRVLESPETVDWGGVAAGVRRALDEKHLLISLNHRDASEVMRQMNWDGGMTAVAGDYLMVVDSNVGFNKVNPLIDEQIDYHVWLDGAPRAELQITYRHRGTGHLDACIQEARYGDSYAEMRERCYWDYVRIYLPAGVRIGEISGFEVGSVEPATREWDKTVAGGLLMLAPGEERVVRLTYDLPESVYSNSHYRLDVRKQPGTMAWPISITVEDPACLHGLTSDAASSIDGTPAWIEMSDLRMDCRLDVRCLP